MSDPSPEYVPPPPPPGTPPPAFQPPPGYAAPPVYQPPVAYPPVAYPPVAYQPPAAYQPAPAYAPTPYPAAWAPGQSSAVAVGGAGALLSQFGGVAAWSIGIGVVGIVVPLVSNFYFPILPIAGALNGWRAMVRGRVIGGLVGIGLNIVAGLLSLIASGLLLGGH
jgi:hypothetical protein